MNEEQYKKWSKDACEAMKRRGYTSQEIIILLCWFDCIKGSNERDLIGDARLTAFGIFSCAEPMDNKWSLYDSMMARLFIYAPYILEEYYAECAKD
jgi:hypothetical protein